MEERSASFFNFKFSFSKQSVKKFFLQLSAVAVLCGILLAVCIFSLSAAIVSKTEERIISADEAALLADIDCIIVLGCGVRADGTPSDMLADRVAVGISLYKSGASDRLLMSGDHGREGYDEVNVMKSLAVDEGIEPDDVFCDHAGFSTYESIYRARDIFLADKVIIVTQRYHLHRALYIAEKLGLDAWGVSADLRSYAGQTVRDVREIAARAKDFFFSLVEPEPTFLGDAIPISGSGSLSDG